MIIRRLILVIISLLALHECPAWAQTDTLPQGVGTYRFGYRQFATQDEKYGPDGKMQPLGRPFDKDLSGPGLLRGDGGPELQRLATELQKFDSFADTDDSLLNQLNLGQMHGDVQAEVNAQIYSAAFGLSNRLSLFVGVPVVEASVRASISFVEGSNNAAAISHRLGEISFDQLKQGLAQAAQVNASSIEQKISEKGYEPIGSWNHSGIGDVQTGSIYSVQSKIAGDGRAIWTLRTTVNVPTGYVEDSDILTDVSTGKGYWGLNNALSSKLAWQHLWLGAAADGGYNFATKRTKRVPEANEGLIDPSRTVETTMSPGTDLGLKLLTGLRYGILQSSYTFGNKRHLRDHYSGPLEGNYSALSATSAENQTYQEIGVGIQTIDLYRSKRFLIPLTLDFSAHLPVMGSNTSDERYFQVELGSFFSTPLAASPRSNGRKSSGRAH